MDLSNMLGVPVHSDEVTALLNSNSEQGHLMREYVLDHEPGRPSASPAARRSRRARPALPTSYPICLPHKHYLICFPRFVFRDGPVRAHARNLGPVHKAEFRSPHACGDNCVNPRFGRKCAEGLVSCIRCIECRFVKKMDEIKANLRLARELENASLNMEDEDTADRWHGELEQAAHDLIIKLPTALRTRYETTGFEPMRRRAIRHMREDRAMFDRTIGEQGNDPPSEHSDSDSDEDDDEDDDGDIAATMARIASGEYWDVPDASEADVSDAEPIEDDEDIDLFIFFNHRTRQIDGIPAPGSVPHILATTLFTQSMLWMVGDQLFLWEQENGQDALQHPDLIADIWTGRWCSILLLSETVAELLNGTEITEATRSSEWQRATYLFVTLHLLALVTNVIADGGSTDPMVQILIEADASLNALELRAAIDAARAMADTNPASMARREILRQAVMDRHMDASQDIGRMPYEVNFRARANKLIERRIGLLRASCSRLGAATEDADVESERMDEMHELETHLHAWLLAESMVSWELEHNAPIAEHAEVAARLIRCHPLRAALFREEQDRGLATAGVVCRNGNSEEGMPWLVWQRLSLVLATIATGEAPSALWQTTDMLVETMEGLIRDAEANYGANGPRLRAELAAAQARGARHGAQAERRRAIMLTSSVAWFRAT